MHPHTASNDAHGPTAKVPGYHYNRIITVHHKYLCQKSGNDMPKIAQEKNAVMLKAKRFSDKVTVKPWLH